MKTPLGAWILWWGLNLSQCGKARAIIATLIAVGGAAMLVNIFERK